LCNLLKRALSYNMIEKNFYKLGRWWKKRFSSPPLPAYNGESPWRSPPVVEPEQRRRRRRKRRSRAGVLVRLEENVKTGLLSRVFFWLMFSPWITSWMNSGAGWRFNGTLKTVTFWFSRKLGSTPRSRTPPLFPRDFPSTDRTGQLIQGRAREEEVSASCHGEQQVVLRCGGNFYGLFSGPTAPHDQMPALLSSAQKLKRDRRPVTRTIQQWSHQSDSALHDCFSTTECTEQTPTTQVIWRSTGSPGTRTPESHQQRKETQYRDKVESHYKGSNTRSMWAGLKTHTDYKRKISGAEVMSASLPDELNTFYACFESTSPAVEVQKAQEDHCPPHC
ncbi:hypothetical protein L3Q82_016723, partial [Scortum barcoo]